MQKEELLQGLRQLVGQGLIGKKEILQAYEEGLLSQEKEVQRRQHRIKLSEILYYIGGAIIFIGIAILVVQNWSDLTKPTRVVITFGSAIAAYITGVIFIRQERFGRVGLAFHLVAALLMPVGLVVVFDSAGFDLEGAGWQSIIAAILFVAYLASYLAFRKILFIVFDIAFATWLFFGITQFLLSKTVTIDTLRFAEYRILVAGLAFLLLARFFQTRKRIQNLARFLYGLGILAFLGAGLALGGWAPHASVFWELIFPGLVFAVMFLSVYLKNTSFLVFGAVFLMIYILKITGEYFSKGLGWPFALVLAGLVLIGLGYATFHIKKRYIDQP